MTNSTQDGPAPEQAAPPAASASALDELKAQLDRALRESSELEADFRNYRRHAEERLARARQEATHEVLAGLGDLVRDLERASAAVDQDPEAVRLGIALVARGIRAVFDRHGLERIPTRGEPFDPAVHEAALVEHRPDLERGTVVRELSPGFRTAGRVIRPARVAVAA